MKRDRRLLNGELVSVEVPDAAELPPSQTFSVLMVGGVEVELNSGRDADLEHYLEVSGTTLTGELTLRGGERLRHGRWGGDPRGVLAFSVTVGEHEVYGFTPDTDVETLAGWLSALGFAGTPEGPVLDAADAGSDRPVTWSPYRTHVLAQSVIHPASPGYLLDVRRARADGVGGQVEGSGTRVAGGLLSRSGDDERQPYVVLETADVVCYGLPAVSAQIPAVVDSLSGVRVTVSAS